MGKKARLFLQALPVAMLTALVPRRSKAIGSQTPIHQTTYRGANGSAEEANQCDNLMPKLPLLSGAYRKPQQTYNVPLLQSYGGYPVISAKAMGLEDYFNKDGRNVAGMAWGGSKNPPGQGGGEPSVIVPNQNYFKNNPEAYNALVKLEAARHWMDENNYNPKFKITPEMQEWRKKTFENIGPAGEAYRTNDNAFRQTIISRVIGGDSNVPNIPDEALKEIKLVQQRLEKADKSSKPTLSQMFTSAMQMKNK
jgi:hypothetical protein